MKDLENLPIFVIDDVISCEIFWTYFLNSASFLQKNTSRNIMPKELVSSRLDRVNEKKHTDFTTCNVI